MNKKYITSLLAIVVLILVAYIYYKNNKPIETSIEEALIKNEVNNETKSSSVYRNEKFGFELNPKNLTQIKEEKDSVWFSELKQCGTAYCPSGIVFITNIDPKYSNLESIRKREEFVTWSSNIKISGEPAILGVSNEASGQSFAIVLHNGKEYRLTWDIVLDQEILASFKFTN